MNTHTHSHFHTGIHRKKHTQSDRNTDINKRRGSERRWTTYRLLFCQEIGVETEISERITEKG